MNPLLSKLQHLMYEYNPQDFNNKYNENLEFLVDQDQKNKVENHINNVNSFDELNDLFNNINEVVNEKCLIDVQMQAYIYENLYAFITTVSDLKECNIDDFLKQLFK